MPSPIDLREGGELGILAREVRDLCGDVKELRKEVGSVKEDVAYMRGKMEGGQVAQTNSTKIKVALITSIGMGITGFIAAILAYFKPA